MPPRRSSAVAEFGRRCRERFRDLGPASLKPNIEALDQTTTGVFRPSAAMGYPHYTAHLIEKFRLGLGHFLYEKPQRHKNAIPD
jgi:hypothetical protein